VQFVSSLNSQLLMKVCSFGKLLYVIVLYYIFEPLFDFYNWCVFWTKNWSRLWVYVYV